MNVSEIFFSIQGEGLLAGAPSVFIRLAGCPVKCKWCDTAYAFDYNSDDDMSVEQIAEKAKKYDSNYYVITGGEPLLEQDMTERQGLKELLDSLSQFGGHITIETSGIEFVSGLSCDLMSISPKLSNSGIENACNLDSLQQMLIEYNCQFKFVIEGENDIDHVQKVVKSLTGINRDQVLLMPQAKTRDEYIQTAPIVAQLCLKHGFTFSPRLQLLIWDNERGK